MTMMSLHPTRAIRAWTRSHSRPAARQVMAYAVALLAVESALILKLLLGPLARTTPFLFLFGATMVAAWWGGREPAMLAVIVAALGVDYLFLPPFGTLDLTRVAAVELLLFVVEASIVNEVIVRLRETREEALSAEARLLRENRAHQALSRCNEVLVRARDEQTMLEEICRTVVEVAGYRMAWVGLARDDQAKTVEPVAAAGLDAGYVASAQVSWADDEHGRGPTGTAIRTGRPSVQQDLQHAPTFAPWRSQALSRGFAASIALPLRSDSHVLGALSIYASEPAAFDDEEVRLLRELADDTAFAMNSLRTRARADALTQEHARVLEEASRAKDDFLRVASHELRTPLTPIIGWAQMLSRDARRPGGIEATRLDRGLDAILRSARSEATLVEDVLDVSRCVAGEMEMERAPVDLGSIAARPVQEARPTALAKGIDLELTTGGDTSVIGDERRLAEVVRRLLSNALKFTPSGGMVRVVVRRARDAVLLEVSDTGQGIESEMLERIFQRFQPGDPSSRRVVGGLGVGLFLVRAIVEAHGGSVHAESPGRGKGTRVVVRLPPTPR